MDEFAAVYARWFDEVARWARAMGGPSADLEDVCQEVFLTVRRKLPTFDGRNLPGWLYRITQRAVRTHLRKAWFRRALYLGPEDWSQFESHAQDPSEELLARERRTELADMLAKLSLPKRTALILHEVEGRSGEEIAAWEGVPVATIYTRLHYAKRELAELSRKRRKL